MEEKHLKIIAIKVKTHWFSIVFAIILCIIALIFIFGTVERGQNSPVMATTVATAKTKQVVIAIEGMSCTSCAAGIKAMLKRTVGVVSSEVSFERKEAVVKYNPLKTSREKIVEVITDMGYKASIKD